MKKKTPSWYKKKLDKLFSEYVRRSADPCKCYTCGKLGHWKSMQAGHYIPRNHLATRWDERNVKVQCVGCNVWGGGKSDVFAVNLREEYGQDVLEELQKAKVTITNIGVKEMEELIEVYQNNLKEL